MACVLVAAAPAAHASFELMMALDRTDKVVHRYDPFTGVYLGSFGSGIIQNPLGMVIDQNSQTAFILQNRPASGQDYITRLNYNTGEFLGTFQLFSSNANSIGLTNNGQFMCSVIAPDVSLINSTGGEAAWVTSPVGVTAGAYSGIAQDIHGTVYAVTDNGVIYGWTNPFTTNGARPLVSLGAPTALASRGQLAARGNWIAAGNQNTLVYARTVASGGFNLTSGVSTPYTNVRGVAIGHENMMYAAGQTGVSVGSISRYDQFGNFAGSFGAGQLKDPIALSVVVAPEPGTMAALGLGLAALLKRRRKANL